MNAPNTLSTTTPGNQAKETLSVIERHARAMDTKDPRIVAADYSEDAIVMGTIFSRPLVGKAELEAAVADLFKNTGSNATVSAVRFMKKETVGEYGYLVFESDSFFGTETYVVRNGAIVFESSTIYPKT